MHRHNIGCRQSIFSGNHFPIARLGSVNRHSCYCCHPEISVRITCYISDIVVSEDIGLLIYLPFSAYFIEVTYSIFFTSEPYLISLYSNPSYVIARQPIIFRVMNPSVSRLDETMYPCIGSSKPYLEPICVNRSNHIAFEQISFCKCFDESLIHLIILTDSFVLSSKPNTIFSYRNGGNFIIHQTIRFRIVIPGVGGSMVPTHSSPSGFRIFPPISRIARFLTCTNPHVLSLNCNRCNLLANQTIFTGAHGPTVNGFVITVQSVGSAEPNIFTVHSNR